MALPLEGKVALVTGSSRGIGKNIALHLARDGADIAVCARSEASTDELPGSIGETAAQIEALGRQALAVRMDVTDDASVKTAVQQVLERFGHIDILVNNAAWVGGVAYLSGDASALERSFVANVRAPFVVGQAVAPSMASNGGGIIVNISSGAGRNPLPPGDPNYRSMFTRPGQEYGLTKAALDRLSTGLAHELHAQNIAVVSVDPGFTLTERLERSPPPGMDMSRAGSPDLTGKAVTFICREPMAFTGRLISSRELVEKEGL
jgi:citronellol/citronellal dehydrogenase